MPDQETIAQPLPLTFAEAAKLYHILAECVTTYSNLISSNPANTNLLVYCRSRQVFLSKVQEKMKRRWPDVELHHPHD